MADTLESSDYRLSRKTTPPINPQHQSHHRRRDRDLRCDFRLPRPDHRHAHRQCVLSGTAGHAARRRRRSAAGRRRRGRRAAATTRSTSSSWASTGGPTRATSRPAADTLFILRVDPKTDSRGHPRHPARPHGRYPVQGRQRHVRGPHQHRVRARRTRRVRGRRHRPDEGRAGARSRSTFTIDKYVHHRLRGLRRTDRRARRHRCRRAGRGLRPLLLRDGTARRLLAAALLPRQCSTWTA